MNAPDKPHQPPEYVHRDERKWETIRWPRQTGKMPDSRPTTGGRPIYDERFNLQLRKPVAEERTDR